MRSSTLSADAGFSMREERSSKTSRRGPKKAPFWRGAFEGKRGFRRIVMIGFAGVVAIGVPINALMLQEGPHPAPLFHFGAKEAALRPGATGAKEVPLPPARPASLAAAPAEAPPPAPKAEAPKAQSKPFDAIGALLSGDAPAKSETVENKDKNVLFAQKALGKLGYGLRQDGVFGGTTRQAIEKFERANGMPVTGELTQKILHKLSAKSGLAMK